MPGASGALRQNVKKKIPRKRRQIMQIREIMTPNPEMIPMDALLIDAAMKMKDLDVGIMPVARENSVVGVVTDRDIVLRAVAEKRDPSRTKVKDIMSEEVLTCPENTELDDAAKRMEEKKVRRLIVTDPSGKAVGIVSLGDIATKSGKERKVEMGGEVLTRVSEPSRSSHH
jgi:CBS domain-containing protein